MMTTAVSIPTTGNKQGRRSADEWRALIVQFSQSRKTRSQFCERYGLTLSTFDRWHSLLRQEPAARSQTTRLPPGALFVELPDGDKPVVSPSAAWDVELELGAGMFVRLRRGAC